MQGYALSSVAIDNVVPPDNLKPHTKSTHNPDLIFSVLD